MSGKELTTQAHQIPPFRKIKDTIHFENQNFYQQNTYTSLEHIQTTMLNYMDTSHYIFKKCITRKNHQVKSITFMCVRHRTGAGCAFQVDFTLVHDIQSWLPTPINLFHTHPPLIEKIYQQKRKSIFSIEESNTLSTLLLQPAYLDLTAESIKIQMEYKFPKHGEFDLKKIRSRIARALLHAHSNVTANSGFSGEGCLNPQFIGCAKLDMANLSPQVNCSPDLTPMNKLTLDFDDISNDSFKWESLPN